jgi:uncharacterized RDD family membrane protein YckC
MENSFAGFWKRFWAGLIDILITIVPCFVIFVIWERFYTFFHDKMLEQIWSPDFLDFAENYPDIIIGDLIKEFYPQNIIYNNYDIITFSVLVITLIIINWLYCTILEKSKFQGTLGKQILGIKVTDLNYGKLTFSRSNARYWARYISIIIFLVGFILSAFTKKKQALHDIIAKTLVVKKTCA